MYLINKSCFSLFVPFSAKANVMDHVVTEKRDEAQTEFLYCCGAITEVLKFGSSRLHSEHKVLFVIIPGVWYCFGKTETAVK